MYIIYINYMYNMSLPKNTLKMMVNELKRLKIIAVEPWGVFKPQNHLNHSNNFFKLQMFLLGRLM